MTFSGLITPLMYPGDGPWVGASKAYGSMNILMEAILRNHGVAISFIGYIATEGFGEYFFYAGIVAMILGSKIVIRDQKSNTLDLIFSQSISITNIFKERLAAITLEIFMLFLLNYLGYIVGIYISGNGIDYIPYLGIGIFLTYLIVITMTYIITMTSVFIKNPGKAVAIAGGIYFGLLLVFMISYTIDQIQIFSLLTPFYWIDRIRILYEKNISLEDILTTFVYIMVILVTYLISLKKIKFREFF
jgi:ABC-type transport system involved in multi-copper enzyme maturation permease subunit